MSRFLSDEWFATAAGLVGAVKTPADAGIRIGCAAGDDRWHLTGTEGEPLSLGRGAAGSDAPELRWERADAVRIWRRELRGDDAMARTTVADGSYVGPVSPADLLQMPALAEMPTIAEASMTVQYDFAAGPFGRVHHVLVFDEGRLVRDQWGLVTEPDVTVHVPYAAIARVRAGEWTILDAMENGTIEGEIGPMAMLAGILEHPSFQAAERATGRHAYTLAALGRLDADADYEHAMTELATATDPE